MAATDRATDTESDIKKSIDRQKPKEPTRDRQASSPLPAPPGRESRHSHEKHLASALTLLSLNTWNF